MTPPDHQPPFGVLLVGHGTRSEPGTQQFRDLAVHLATRIAPLPLEPAFLELQQPDIAAAVGRLLDRRVQGIVVMPLLLFAAEHAKRDIPDAVGAALSRRGQSDLPLAQAGHLGCHPAVLELSRRRLRELPGSLNRPELLLLVGRGSLDNSATAEMQDFARLRQQAEGIPTEVAFLAMARPALAERLAELAAANLSRVMVQPHLLFAGELAESVARQVAEVERNHPETEWNFAPLLGDPVGCEGHGTCLLAEAIADRIAQAAQSAPGPKLP